MHAEGRQFNSGWLHQIKTTSEKTMSETLPKDMRSLRSLISDAMADGFLDETESGEWVIKCNNRAMVSVPSGDCNEREETIRT